MANYSQQQQQQWTRFKCLKKVSFYFLLTFHDSHQENTTG